MSAAAQLRTLTQPLHDRVDAAFGKYRLDDPASYRRFLHAHALALPAVERTFAAAALPDWRPRTSLLAADLRDLGINMPPPLPFELATLEAGWGALYVVEGSRLGGAILARTVPQGLPSRYLAAAHLSGEWRALRAAIDRAAAAAGAAWLPAAQDGAAATFALYERAAAFYSDRETV